MCFYGDGDHAVIQERSRPKARKQYRCYECRGVILPGETHQYLKSLYEGSWDVVRTCLKCEAVREFIADIEQARGCHGEEAWCPFGELAQAINEDGEHYGMLKPGPDEGTPTEDGWEQ